MKRMRSSRDIRYLKRKKNLDKLSISTSHQQLASLSLSKIPKTTKSIEQISTVAETTREEYQKIKKSRLPTLAQTIIESKKAKMSKVKEQPYFEENWREAIAKKLRVDEAARRRTKEVMKKKTLSMRRYKVIHSSLLIT